MVSDVSIRHLHGKHPQFSSWRLSNILALLTNKNYAKYNSKEAPGNYLHKCSQLPPKTCFYGSRGACAIPSTKLAMGAKRKILSSKIIGAHLMNHREIDTNTSSSYLMRLDEPSLIAN